MDFTSDRWADKLRIRTFNVVDVFTRERLGIAIALSLPSQLCGPWSGS
jgi:hypothetical protein